MRRRLAVVLIVPALLVTACSGGEPEKPKAVEVDGELGGRPEISFPAGDPPPKKLKTEVLVEGHGAVVKAGEYVQVKLFAKVWDGGDDYVLDASKPDIGAEVIKLGQSLPALNKGLPGKKVGSRVLLVAPPADAWPDGSDGLGVEKTDSVALVVDILKAMPVESKAGIQGPQRPSLPGMPTVTADGKSEPKITIPKGARPPKTLQSQVLVQGSGAVIEPGQTLVTQLISFSFPDGKKKTSSWDSGEPLTFPIGKGWLPPGVDEGLRGRQVGDRVLLVAPADGKSASEVYVIDILDAA